jgi:hypothetical protein
VPVISSPTVGTTWKVGQQLSFSGSATDQQDGTLPASKLTWLLTIMHCPSNCHPHDIQTFPGVASGSFFAPDHEYPSWLELKLTATDSNGVSASTIRRVDPRTVALNFQTAPTGLQIAFNGVLSTAPFTMTVIEGSSSSVTAVSPQVLGSTTYAFQGWSDGGAGSHNIVAPVSGTYTATFTQTAGNAYAATVLQDAPVAYWRFGETSGTTAADSAGANTGTYTGGYTLGRPGALTGDPSTAVLLNGTSGYVNVPDANPLDLGNGPLTYELWVQRADAGTSYQLLYTKYSQGNVFFFNNKFTFDNDNNDIVAESGTTTDTNWHHFVVTRTGTGTGNTKIYKDGVNVTTEIGITRTLASNASNVSLGRYTVSDGLFFKGSLDEVAVYPTALSAARVQAHYAAAAGG